MQREGRDRMILLLSEFPEENSEGWELCGFSVRSSSARAGHQVPVNCPYTCPLSTPGLIPPMICPFHFILSIFPCIVLALDSYTHTEYRVHNTYLYWILTEYPIYTHIESSQSIYYIHLLNTDWIHNTYLSELVGTFTSLSVIND